MLQLTINENRSITLTHDGTAYTGDQLAAYDISKLPSGFISVLYKGKSYTALLEKIDKAEKKITLRINGKPYDISVKEPLDALLEKMGIGSGAARGAGPVKAPMPGMVLKLLVTEGQQVAKGDSLLILEAMKMENVIKATAAATVKGIKVKPQTAVEKGAVLIEME